MQLFYNKWFKILNLYLKYYLKFFDLKIIKYKFSLYSNITKIKKMKKTHSK